MLKAKRPRVDAKIHLKLWFGNWHDKKGYHTGIMVADVLFIVRNDNKIIQPVITHELLTGFSEGDVIRFDHKQIFLGMVSCGENVETAELLCVDVFKSESRQAGLSEVNVVDVIFCC